MKIKKLLMTLVAMVLALGAVANLSAVEVSSKTTTKDGAPEVKVEKKTTTTTTTSTTHSVNINTASKTDLENLDGIGPIRAQKIIDNRPYKSVDQLINADIPESTIKKLHSQLSTGALTMDHVTKSGTIVNLNTASREQLEALDGIGTIRAQKIIDSRPYKTVEDLIRADIPKSTIDKISRHVTVGNGLAATGKTEKKTTGGLNRNRVNEPSGAQVKVDTTPKVKAENTPRISVSRVPSGARVNINTASKAELEALPEIGPIKAQAIIENRPFKSAEDIMRVPGIKEATYDTIKSSITVK